MGCEKAMKKVNKYILNYSLQIVLNIVLILLIVWFSTQRTIDTVLVVTFPFNLFQFTAAFSVLALLSVFLIVEILLLVLAVKQTKRGVLDNKVKKAGIILPILFVILLQFAFWIPLGLTDSKYDLTNIPTFAIKTSDDEMFSGKPFIDTICEKNILGKAGYYDNTYVADKGSVSFVCSYHESYKNILQTKFVNDSVEDITLKNKITGDEYTAFYGTKNGAKQYTFLIQKGNIYFEAIYRNEDIDEFDYSIQEFVDDSLTIYNQWLVY